MIVECQNCTTRFQLDESRIPLVGIRVRCSKCKEAFFLEHPSATQAQAVDELAFDAAANEATPAPGSTQDLVMPPTAARSVSQDAGAFTTNLEDDWEFNHDESVEDFTPSPEPALGEGLGFDADTSTDAGSPRENFGGCAADNERPNDEVFFDDSDIDASEISGIDVDGIDDDSEAASEAVPDASSSLDLQHRSEPHPDSDSAPGHSSTGDLSGVIHPDGYISQESAHFQPADAGPDAFSAIGESAAVGPEGEVDLGEPEDWDLLGGDLSVPCVTAPARTSVPAPAAAQMASPHAAEALAPTPVSIERPTLRLQSGLRSAGTALGWVLTLALLAATLWQGVHHSLADVAAPAVTEFEVGPWVARSVEAAWIPTIEGRTLLSVRGELHNPTDVPMKLQHVVMVSLLDASGMPLDIPELQAGRTIDADALRDLPTPLRERVAVEASDALSAVTLAGGASVPFAAYFSDVPTEVRRVSVAGVQPELAYDEGRNFPWAESVAAGLERPAAQATGPISRR